MLPTFGHCAGRLSSIVPAGTFLPLTTVRRLRCLADVLWCRADAVSRASDVSPIPSSATTSKHRRLPSGPGLHHFLAKTSAIASSNSVEQSRLLPADAHADEYLNADMLCEPGRTRKVYLEVYGCQMNAADADVVLSILQKAGYVETAQLHEADAILVLTCSIREGAERRLMRRLRALAQDAAAAASAQSGIAPRLAVLGCMAERLKQRLFCESGGIVDVVAGPDSYRHLPRLLAAPQHQPTAMHVQLSLEETYADVRPSRRLADAGSPTAFVSVMRGCDNMCTYCVVPFTRGRERTRPLVSIVDEVRQLVDAGVREVTLLGQNVNSYRDTSDGQQHAVSGAAMSRGFRTVYRARAGGLRFAELLAAVADVHPELRVRFTSPHPKDFPDELLHLIAERDNVCSCLHLPAQAGSTRVLEAMGRGYSREAYLDLVQLARATISGVSLTSDLIAGFCGETDADFEQTLSLMRAVRYDFCYMYSYSMREKTRAFHRLRDDVSSSTKTLRRRRMVDVSEQITLEINTAQLGRQQLVLIEARGNDDPNTWFGRTDGNSKVIVHEHLPADQPSAQVQRGDYVVVEIVGCSFDTLYGRPLRVTSLQQYGRELRECGPQDDHGTGEHVQHVPAAARQMLA